MKRKPRKAAHKGGKNKRIDLAKLPKKYRRAVSEPGSTP